MQMTLIYSACLEDIQSPPKEYTLNQELQKVYKWLLANKLKLNVEISKKISRTVLKKSTAYSAQQHTIKHTQCTYSATDKLLFAMLRLQFFCDISLAKKSHSNHLRC